MRSLTESTAGKEAGIILKITTLSPMERERLIRTERARVIGELLADGILWVARLPRRLAELAWFGAPRQRV